MARERILIVEDDEDIQELIRYNLVKDGFHVEAVDSAEAGLTKIRSSPYDIVLLDLMLPGMDGLEACRQIKGDPATRTTLVVMLTARGEEADVVTGLEMGSDDYVIKPFSPRVLTARVRAVLRRRGLPPAEKDAPLGIGDIEIHPGRHEARIGGRLLDLTFTEFRILHFLAQHPGWVFTRYQIVDAVRGENYPVTERSVDVQIVGLRRKMGPAGKCIETVRGVGYRLKD